MSAHKKSQQLDIIVTIILFIAGAYGLYQSLQYPGRSGMWPTFVMVTLLLVVGIHLINLFRNYSRAPANPLVDAEISGEGE